VSSASRTDRRFGAGEHLSCSIRDGLIYNVDRGDELKGTGAVRHRELLRPFTGSCGMTTADHLPSRANIAAIAIAEERYRALVRATSSLVWTSAPDGQIVDMPEWRAYTGTTVEQIKGWGWLDTLHPGDRERARIDWQQAVDARSFYETEYRIRRADGVYVWHQARGTPILEVDGSVREWCGLCANIQQRKDADTKRIEAEIALRRNIEAIAIGEERYRALVRATSSLVWITPPDGQIFDQPEWRAYTDTSVQQIKGWGWLDTLHPDDRDRARIDWQRAVDTRSFYETEYRIRRADGIYVWHQARGIPILEADGSVREWFGFCADIQERKDADAKRVEAEKALRRLNDVLEHRVEMEARERARIWNVSQDMLVVADLEGIFLSLNPAWTTTLSWPESDLVGRTCEWLVHSDDWNSTRAEVLWLAAGNTTRHFENRLRHKDGSFRWFSWTAVPDRDRIYAVLRDISGIKEAEEELRSSRQELARVGRLMTLGAVTASIAHEVKQPIAAARNNARAALNFLNADPPELGEVNEALGCVIGDADRAGLIIDRFRDHIKKAPTQKERFDLNEAINEVIVLARGAINQNRVSVQTRMVEGSFSIEGDRVQLQQVLLNLVLNAVEAVGLVEEGPRELSISTRQSQAGGALVAVVDSGPGIDPQDLERVFEGFYTTKSGGLGVGLTICRSVIKAHGGRLWAQANEPRGAVFQFTLPDAKVRTASAAVGRSVGP
jgi:PAS domain S-box-containing protein